MSDEGHDPGEGRNHSDPGTAVGRSANNPGSSVGGFSTGAAYAGYTTGSTENAVTQAHVDAARESAASDKSDDGSGTISALAAKSKEDGTTLASVIGREPSRSELGGLQANGYGDMDGVNPKNLSGQTVNQLANSKDFSSAADKAVSFIGNVAKVGLATNPATAVPFGIVNAAIGVKNAMERGESLGDAVASAVSNLALNKLAATANAAFMGALPGAVAKGVSGYNSVASVANAADPGSMPGVNPGQALVGAMKSGTQGEANSGMTAPDGSPVNVNGWSSGASGTNTDKPAAANTVIEKSAAPTGVSTIRPVAAFNDISFQDFQKGKAV